MVRLSAAKTRLRKTTSGLGLQNNSEAEAFVLVWHSVRASVAIDASNARRKGYSALSSISTRSDCEWIHIFRRIPASIQEYDQITVRVKLIHPIDDLRRGKDSGGIEYLAYNRVW